MLRMLIAFLLALLPLQFAWGAAAAYCRHEQGAAAGHFGHHGHQHEAASKADTASVSAGEKSSKADLPADDPDCGVCHLSCARPISSPNAMPACAPDSPAFAPAGPLPAASPPSAIERPKWSLA